MTTIKAHFDGKVIVPDEPVDLPVGKRLQLRVTAQAVEKKTTGKNAIDSQKQPGTARDLLNSGLIGIWADRTDIKDGLEYAQQLRRRAEQREG